MDLARTLCLLIAAGTTGLVAGIVLAYHNSVMPGLAKSDDRTFIDACQRLNTAIQNPLFMAVSNVALLAIVASTVLHLPADHRELLPWTIAALFLYVLTLAITLGGNVPLNNALIKAGHPDALSDTGTVRRGFENRWNRMNALRTVTTTAAFCCLLIALATNA